MTRFETPGAVQIDLDLSVASVHVVAGHRADTVIDVRPADPASRADVLTAEEIRVDRAGDQVSVVGRRSWRGYVPWGGTGSAEVRIELPAGSRLTGRLAAGTVRCSGPLGECRLKAGAGDIDVEQASPVRLRTGAGDIEIGQAGVQADVVTGSGAVRLGRVDGSAVVKNSNGATEVAQVSGDLRVHAANGSIVLDRVDGTVVAKTANGDVRIGCVRAGSVVAETGCGDVDLGISHGLAAWLDLQSHFGQVVNHLEQAGRPAPDEPTVDVRARTAMGDITVRRCADDGSEKMSVPADSLQP